MEVDRRTGVLFVFIAAVLYSIGGLCIKVIPWSGIAINGGRTAIALVVIGAFLAATKHPPRLNRWIFLGAVCVFGTNLLYAVANKLTTAANTIVLQFTAPIFVIVFSLLFWHKRPKRLDLIACAVVFGGVLFFFVDSLEMGGGLGNFLALLSGVSYAGVFLMNDMPDSDALSSVFWGEVLSSVTGLPFLIQETEFPPTAILSLVVLGVFQVALAYILLAIGLKTTPPVMASLVSGQPGLRYRAGAQPHSGGGILSGVYGPLRPRGRGGGHCGRGGVQCDPGPAGSKIQRIIPISK